MIKIIYLFNYFKQNLKLNSPISMLKTMFSYKFVCTLA